MERWTGGRVGSRAMRRKGVRSGGSDAGEARGSIRRRSRRDGDARVEVVGSFEEEWEAPVQRQEGS
jgi:hypothetical protein